MANAIKMKLLKSIFLGSCIAVLTNCASDPSPKVPMTPAEFKSIPPFTTTIYDAVWDDDDGAKVIVRAPVAYFGTISSEFPYRILPVDGPGSGGAVIDIARHPELVDRFDKASAEGKTLWIAMSGFMKQYVAEGRYNPETMPDTLMTKSHTLGYDLTEPVIFSASPEIKP